MAWAAGAVVDASRYALAYPLLTAQEKGRALQLSPFTIYFSRKEFLFC